MEQTSPEMLQRMADAPPPQVDWEQEHSRLHAVVDELERRAWLSPEEELRLKNVKKQRLRAKDKLAILGRLP